MWMVNRSPPELLTTDRLLLRPWRPDDVTALAAALDESIGELRAWVPWASAGEVGRARAAELIEKWSGDFDAGVNFVYATFARAEGVLVGGVGLYPRVGPGAIEIGYWISTPMAGRGFATEAARLLTTVGFAMPGIAQIEMHCARDNLASRKIPDKLGYRVLVDSKSSDSGLMVYQLIRGE
jgi:RimJ/RimL family protein N-acetyltransferase